MVRFLFHLSGFIFPMKGDRALLATGGNTLSTQKKESSGALASLICGILSLIGFTFLLGIPAVILGLKARKTARTHPDKYTDSGWALLGIMGGIIGSLFWPLYIIPSFEAPNRAKVSRSKSEMRNISVALEAYFIDHQCYPPSLNFLTTPVTYLADIPLDPYLIKKEGTKEYDYALSDNHLWILRGVGPDGIPNTDLTRLLSGSKDQGEIMRRYHSLEYDPTNGTTSSGDVFRTGP